MATPNRATLLTKTHKVLKKHFKPTPIEDRPVLEQLLFACLLENARYEAAQAAYRVLSTQFFDWNEVRVSTVRELTESLHMLPDPATASRNAKQVLQSVFESSYSFELESLKRETLGKACQRLAKIEGVTSFAIAYMTQATLGGHAIPVDKGLASAFLTIGIASAEEVEKLEIGGLERAIPKSKGVEFASLAHQLGAEMIANPYSPALHKILLEIAPDAKDRLPKKPSKSARPTESAADGAGAKDGEAKTKRPASPAEEASPKKPGSGDRAKESKPSISIVESEKGTGRIATPAPTKQEAVGKPAIGKPAIGKPATGKSAAAKPATKEEAKKEPPAPESKSKPAVKKDAHPKPASGKAPPKEDKPSERVKEHAKKPAPKAKSPEKPSSKKKDSSRLAKSKPR